jgi:hypothetical protein
MRCRLALFWSPRQYAADERVSLNAGMYGGRDVRTPAQIAPDAFAGAGIEVVVGGQLVAADLHDIGSPDLSSTSSSLNGSLGNSGAPVLGLVHPPDEQLAVLDDLAIRFSSFEVLGVNGSGRRSRSRSRR